MGNRKDFAASVAGKSYQERLRGYERDKQELLSSSAPLTPTKFCKRLKALQNKWKI